MRYKERTPPFRMLVRLATTAITTIRQIRATAATLRITLRQRIRTTEHFSFLQIVHRVTVKQLGSLPILIMIVSTFLYIPESTKESGILVQIVIPTLRIIQ
mgnify:CR=1 FL=1